MMMTEPKKVGTAQGSLDPSKLPACDNCKDRKTKCDRASPCSSCITANLSCRVTRTRPEKRQRILISAKYDEALERVDHRLQEVLSAVNALQHHSPQQPTSFGQPNLQNASDFPTNSTFKSSSQDSSDDILDGYRGESSFESQFDRILVSLNSLNNRLGQQSFTPNSPTSRSSNYQFGSQAQSLFAKETRFPPPFSQKYPELEGNVLPPTKPVLKILRLCQTAKQRFFVDFSFFDEEEFTEMCRDVFFATSPYTLPTWSIVNAGLFYLFADLKSQYYPNVGLDQNQIDKIVLLLGKNSEAAIGSFRITSEPSLRACQALALLGTHCIKSGQVINAWNCFSMGSRMCMDIGLHRLSPGPGDHWWFKRRQVFWNIYIYDKHLALTLGRTQALHDYDISTDRLYYSNDVLGIPGKIALAFGEVAVIAGRIQSQLFSASSHQLSPESRRLKVKEFYSKLKEVEEGLIKPQSDSISGSEFMEASLLLDYLLYSTYTVNCSALEFGSANVDPVQINHTCHDCLHAARQALAVLVRVGDERKHSDLTAWTRFLNMFLSMSPFRSYIVLVINALNHNSALDLGLLACVNSVMEPVSSRSPLVRRLLPKCQRLYQLVEALAGGGLEDHPLLDTPSSSTTVENTMLLNSNSYEIKNLIEWPLLSQDLDLDVVWSHH